jgi:hypothetical protein
MPAPLRDRLRREAQRLRVPEDVVERDYALGHVLAALYGQAELADCLVFKGGTALKKAYFGDYRFSVDLDFSAVGGPRRAALEAYESSAKHRPPPRGSGSVHGAGPVPLAGQGAVQHQARDHRR